MKEGTEQTVFCDTPNATHGKGREPATASGVELPPHIEEAKPVTKFRFPARSRYAQLLERDT